MHMTKTYKFRMAVLKNPELRLYRNLTNAALADL